MRFSQHLRQLGQPIAYYPKMAKPLGGVTAAILFCQLFYWQDKTDNPLGVYKTQAELEQETGLSRREQETARKKLVELGLLIETHKRLEHRIYFKLDLAKFDDLMATIFEVENPTLPDGDNVQPRMAESDIREVAKPPFVNTKTTTENTNNKKDLTNVKSKKATPKPTALALLAEFGITDQLAEDFIEQRKVKKAPITQTVLNRLQTQADIAKLPLVEVVAIMIDRNWTGFNANWDWRGESQFSGKAEPSSKPKFSDENTTWWQGRTIEIYGDTL
ncbi:hypothetical protein [Histophilus somni]|nr:hypothetical protein [Histophilus somni]ACA32561.1 conserved hypothetical protein [Histophilus somni 2336]QQF66078.1 DNA replication protein [Histophilus somni]QQF70819.1 DNA replication protein [Histophilus somni]QQF72659.1 DNA replication protein [Histophilus somni]QQF84559.1 DNA replication protein [Histophilus somni]